jgi:hypothetical protein
MKLNLAITKDTLDSLIMETPPVLRLYGYLALGLGLIIAIIFFFPSLFDQFAPQVRDFDEAVHAVVANPSSRSAGRLSWSWLFGAVILAWSGAYFARSYTRVEFHRQATGVIVIAQKWRQPGRRELIPWNKVRVTIEKERPKDEEILTAQGALTSLYFQLLLNDIPLFGSADERDLQKIIVKLKRFLNFDENWLEE